MRQYFIYFLISVLAINAGLLIGLNSSAKNEENLSIVYAHREIEPAKMNVQKQADDATDKEKYRDLEKLIAKSLGEIEKIKAGMTRADLLKVFSTQGGMSTGIYRNYVYKNCPYIKVDVEFEPVGRPARDAQGRVTLEEANEDLIKKISKPYLEPFTAD